MTERLLSRADVVIIGAGVIGCAIARHLAHAGARAVVIDRAEPGMEASWAGAGMLSPLAEAAAPGPFLELLRESRRRYPTFAAALEEETGIGIAYRDVGTLFLAFSAADDAELEERWRWQSAARLPIERLSATEVLRLEPALSPTLRWALRFPEDHQVESRSLARALWSAATRAGAEFHVGVPVRRVLHRSGRVEGVELAGETRVEAGAVVVAAGSWAGTIGGLPRPLPVAPVHGQLLAFETLPPLFEHVVDSPRCYLVPRSDGRLIAGTTVEQVGFRKSVTAAGVMSILRGALEIAPGLADVSLTECWSGLRPGTPDELPILGGDPEVSNLFYATGHYRNGILLAPITGQMVGELVLGRIPDVDLEPYAIARFAARD